MKLWSPESPFLYDLVYQVKDTKGNVVDEVKSYAGMRKVHTANGRFYLNNQPYFQRLVLDQGFYPEGIWTAPSDEALKNDIVLGKKPVSTEHASNQKVFEERYYYWADKLGYITWGESASWMLDVNKELAARNFLGEWSEVVVRDRNHPSLVTWTPFNETWGGGPDAYVRLIRDVYNITKAIDPTRPVNDASGDNHVITDIWSVHNYEQDRVKLTEQLKMEEAKSLIVMHATKTFWLFTKDNLTWLTSSEVSPGWQRKTGKTHGDTEACRKMQKHSTNVWKVRSMPLSTHRT